MREKEIIAVSVGARFQFEQSVAEGELNSATKIAEFFIKKGYSLFDVLIRCCTERTTISSTGYYSKDLDLHLIRYSLLWEIMKKGGASRDYELIFLLVLHFMYLSHKFLHSI
jgi:hypothetical protein